MSCRYHSELAPHPWFQVQLYDRYLVAGVDLFPRSNALAFQRFHYLEIRVGDNAVNGEPNTAVLTLNQVRREREFHTFVSNFTTWYLWHTLLH